MRKILKPWSYAPFLLLLTSTQSVWAESESFSMSLQLYAPIEVTLQSSLQFPNVSAGSEVTVTTTPEENGSAVFSVTGEPLAAVTGVIVEDSVLLTTGDGIGTEKQITVDSFATGGDLSVAGLGMLDGQGALSNLRVGASAHVSAGNIIGVYSSAATLRLTYN